MANLFGGSAVGADAGGNGYLLQFRAGKMTMTGTTVKADKRKGLVYVVKQGGELLSLVWKDRTTQAEDEPIILFADEVEFKRCKSCPKERVYYLKFQNDRRDFFWMQEPDEKKDADIVSKLNALIAGNEIGGSGAEAMEQDAGDIPAALRQSLGLDTPRTGDSAATSRTPAATATPAAAPAAPAPARAASAGTSSLWDENVMRGIIAGLAAQTGAVQQGRPEDPTDLADILTAEAIEPLLTSSDIVDRLKPFLPEGSNVSAADVVSNVRSPQFAQAISSFSAALRTGQLDEVMSQFGVDPAEAAAAGGGVIGLCRAIQRKADREKAEKMDESDS